MLVSGSIDFQKNYDSSPSSYNPYYTEAKMQSTNVRFPRIENQSVKGDEPYRTDARSIQAHCSIVWNEIYNVLNGDTDICLVFENDAGRTTRVCQFDDFYRFNSLIKSFKLATLHIFAAKITPTTIRDIYYKDVEIFQRKQEICNRNLQLIFEDSFQISLGSVLQIYPSQKGLIYGGNFEIEFFAVNGATTTVKMVYDNDPMLIPTFERVSCNSRLYVVVLEKDAVFKSFCSYLKKQVSTGSVLVVTGKGFPDRSTRKLLHCLQENKSKFIGFFDSDVDGINIYRSYKEYCPDMVFGGIFLLSNLESCVDISMRDYKLLGSTISKLSRFTEDCCLVQRELKRGLLFHKKAEMNSFSNLNRHILDTTLE